MSFPPGATRRAVLALAASATLLTAGCSQAAPGVVAYVGDAQITQKQLDSAVAGVSTTTEEGQTVSPEAVANAMIQGEIAAQIAAERKISITDTQRDTYLKSSNLAPLINVPEAKPVAYDVADVQLVAQKLGPEAFLAEVERRQVKLNPRFGILDEKQKLIKTDESGSLSQPAAVETPSP